MTEQLPDTTGARPDAWPSCAEALADQVAHTHRCRLAWLHTPLHNCECGAVWPTQETDQ